MTSRRGNQMPVGRLNPGWTAVAMLALLASVFLVRLSQACGPNPSMDTKGSPDPGKSPEPIVLSDGAVTEDATDLSFPLRSFTWTHHRSYSSALNVTDGIFIQGDKWLAGQFTQYLHLAANGNDVEFYVDHVHKRVFTRDGSSPNYTWRAPADFYATLTQDSTAETFTLKMKHTGETLTFHNFDASLAAFQKGLLFYRTDRYGTETLSYTFSSGDNGGRLTQVSDANGWRAVYTYLQSGTNVGKIEKIDVIRNISGVGDVYLQRAKYTYWDAGQGYSNKVGSAGDLIMVEVLKKATGDSQTGSSDNDFSIKRVTQYRYYRDGDADGGDHKLKLVLSPESVARATADGSKTSVQLLGLDDDGANGIVYSPNGQNVYLKDYANALYTYYTGSDYLTTDVDTSEGGVGGDNENLENKYGGGALNEVGFARSETIREDYAGYLGTRTYFYMQITGQASSTKEVTRIVVEDTQQTGTRRIYGLNADRQILRDVFVDDPDGQSPKYWCTSYILGTSGAETNQVKQKRVASAHAALVTSDTAVAKFLDPEGGATTGKNDEDTVSSSAGVVYTYGYDSEGHLTTEGVKKGTGGSEYCLRKTVYPTTPASNQPTHLPTTVYKYPEATTDWDATSRLATSFAYTFHDHDPVVDQQLKTRTITYPTVGADRNGSNVATTWAEYYDQQGRLRWVKDGEGYVSYYSYHPKTGGLAYEMTDVDTGSLPGDITSDGSGTRDAWSGAAGLTRATGLPTAMALAAKTEFDYSGRPVKMTDPGTQVTCVAYRYNSTLKKVETRTYTGWDATAHTAGLPIYVTRANDDDLTTEVFTIDPTQVTEGYDDTTNLPTGVDGEGQSNYVTWTRYAYNATTALLEKADRYHQIPTNGTGTMSTDFYRTFYRHDGLGQRTHVIEVVSGTDETGLTSCVEQVTKTEYDKVGRVKAVSRGVSGASHVMKTTTVYDADPTALCKVTEYFHDEATPGSGTDGIGDGFTTSTLAYYDAANIDADHAIKTIYHRNWRGQLRGVAPEAAPYTVRDVDNMGRITAVAQYQGDVTWATVVDDEDFAATVASDAGTSAERGSLSKRYYDQLSRQYRSEVYNVSLSTGASGGKLIWDSYYDRNSRLVGACPPARGSVEYAFDGAGRQIETRVVTLLKTETRSQVVYHYADTGAFLYRAPGPKNSIGDLSGGDDRVLQLSHYVYDAAGNVTCAVTLEVNHDEADGNGLHATNHDFVQTSTFKWYEANTYYLKTSAYYGSGDSDWKYAALPNPESAPTISGDTCLVTKYDYAKGRLEKVTDPAGSSVKRYYDALGRTTKTEEYSPTPTLMRVTLTQYDGLSNVVKLVADMDKDGAIDDPGDQITEYTYYDSTNSPYDASWTTKIKYPDSAIADDVVSLAYNLDGTLKSRTAQRHSTNDTATVLEFDWDSALRRLTKQRVHTVGTGVDELVRAIGLAYDGLGRTQRVRSYSDETDEQDSKVLNEVDYTYSDLGLLVQEHQEHDGVKDANTLSVQYGYGTATGDTAGSRLINMTYPNGRKAFFNYGSGDADDALSRLAYIIDDNGSGSPAGDALAGYSYNGVARLAVEDFCQPDVRLDYYRDSDGSATAGTYKGFDRFGRVKQQAWRAYTAGSLREHLNYGYDYNSNRSWRQNVLAAAASKMYDEKYDHDGLNRLTAFKQGRLDANKQIPVDDGAQPTPNPQRLRGQEWELTDTGNWRKFKLDANGDGDYEDDNPGNDLEQNERSHDAANQITGITTVHGTDWADPAYDACGNMTTVPKPSGPANAFTCVYDAWNRLVKVSVGANTVAEFRYDGLNRRIRKYTQPYEGDWTVREFYYNAAWQLLEVRKQTKTRGTPPVEPELATLLKEQYVWSARYIDAPVCRDRDTTAGGDLGKTGSGLDERLYYLTDANMNVTALVNTSGAAVERYYYDPYGMVKYLMGAGQYEWQGNGIEESNYDNCVLYCGYWRDSETGLDYVRHRYRQPYLGWITRDPLPAWNLYLYCLAGPTVYTDSLGLQPDAAVSPGLVDQAIAYGQQAVAYGQQAIGYAQQAGAQVAGYGTALLGALKAAVARPAVAAETGLAVGGLALAAAEDASLEADLGRAAADAVLNARNDTTGFVASGTPEDIRANICANRNMHDEQIRQKMAQARARKEAEADKAKANAGQGATQKPLSSPKKDAKPGKDAKPADAPTRTPEENAKARNEFKNNKDAARDAWEQRTGQKWPVDENGNPWPAEHEPPLKADGDPMTVTPRDPGLPDPHNTPGPDGLTDYQRWGAEGTPARQANKKGGQ